MHCLSNALHNILSLLVTAVELLATTDMGLAAEASGSTTCNVVALSRASASVNTVHGDSTTAVTARISRSIVEKEV